MRSGPARRGRAPDDHGTGLVGLTAAVLVVLAFLLFSMQLLMNLTTTSMVTSAGHEGARLVASHEVDHTDPVATAAAQRRAEYRVRRLLGRFGDRVEMDWSDTTADTVVLHLRADAQRFLLPGLAARLGFDRIDRTVRVQVERLR
jgi:hypothetical protein